MEPPRHPLYGRRKVVLGAAAFLAARGAEFTARIHSLKDKYGPNADALTSLTKEIIEKCNPPKS